MCDPSKNGSVFVPFGTVCGAYSIRPYDRLRATLRKTVPFSSPLGRLWGVFDTPLRPGMGYPLKYRYDHLTGYGRSLEIRMRSPPTGYVLPFEKLSRFCPLRGCLWGVFDTPLRLGTCNPSKYRYNFPTGYVRSFKKWIRFRPLRGRLWGIFNTPLRLDTCDPMKYRYNSPTGYGWPFKKLSRFRPLRGRLWGVFNTPLQPGTCGPSKKLSRFRPFRGRGVGRMRYAPTTGYVLSLEIRMRSPNRPRAILRNTDMIS